MDGVLSMQPPSASSVAPRPLLWDLVRPLLPFVTSILPLFLTSTLASQLREDLGFGTARLGMAVAAFFAAGAVASPLLGWLGERLGPARASRGAAAVSGASMAAIAAWAESWTALAVAMVVAGTAQALIEPVANLYLSRTIHSSRLGFAFGIKQAAVPAATLVGGLAVPLVAVPLGWRWVFVGGALAAFAAIIGVPRSEKPRPARRNRREGDVPLRPLVVLAAGVALAGAAAATVAAYIVDAAISAGVSAGGAGLLAALGGALGVITRVTSGMRADRRSGGSLRVVCRMLGIGVVVLLVLAIGTPAAFLVAMPAAYVTAWGWPALLHLAVVRRNPGAPSTATGVVNTGAFIGSVAGPLAFGWVAERHSYGSAWVVSALWCGAGGIAIAFADRLIGEAEPS